MKFHFLKLILVCVSVLMLFSCTSQPVAEQKPSELNYTYAKLKLLDLEQMTELIQEKNLRYQKTNNEAHFLEALQICLCRPDNDGLVDKLIGSLRYSLNPVELWETYLVKSVDNAIAKLKSEDLASEDQVSYLILLNNLLAEIKPEFIKQDKSPAFESLIVEKIAEAQLVVSESATSESSLHLMNSIYSPSNHAQTLIDARTARLKPIK